MPIYAYRCDACGHAKDVLQKISDPVLTTCPACGAGEFRKQLTAAGFQLKGSGWYVTDFKGGNSAGAKSTEAAKPAAGEAKSGETSSPASGETKGESKSETKSDGAASAAPAAGCGGGCACH